MKKLVVTLIIALLLTGMALAAAHQENSYAELDTDGDTKSDTESDANGGDTITDTGDTESDAESDTDEDEDEESEESETDDVESDTDSETDDVESDMDSEIGEDDESEEPETITSSNTSIINESKTDSILLIYDNSLDDELVRQLGNYASAFGIHVFEKRIDFDSRYLRDLNLDAVLDFEYIVLISRDVSGLNVLIDHMVSDGSLDGKKIIISSDAGESVLEQQSLVLHKVASPELLILTNLKDFNLAWDALLTALAQEKPVTDTLNEKDVEFTTVSDEDLDRIPEHRRAVADALLTASESNIPLEALKLILILPLAATIVAIFRNVIGVKSYGIFVPAILSISFLSSGLILGLILFAVLLVTGIFSRKFIERLNLMVVPRLVIILTLCCVVMAAITTIGIKTGNYTLAKATIFPLIVMSFIIENFMRTAADKGLFEALKICLTTVIVALACFCVISLSTLQEIVLTHPEILFLVVGFNILLGRWKGLRLAEYHRFSELRRR